MYTKTTHGSGDSGLYWIALATMDAARVREMGNQRLLDVPLDMTALQ
jgi:hypothetical protein